MSLPMKFKLRLTENNSGVEMYKTTSDGWTWRDTDHQVFTGCDSTANQLAIDNARSLHCDRFSDQFSENEWLFTSFKNPTFSVKVVPIIAEFWATKLDNSDLGYSYKMIEDLVNSTTASAIFWRSKNVHMSAQAAIDSISDFDIDKAKINKFEMIGSELFSVDSCKEGNDY